MNKPITNRVRNGAWGKDAVHQPTLKTGKVESPAKQIEIVTEGEDVEKQRDIIVDEVATGANLTTPDAIGGGTAGKPWENKMTELLGGGRTYEQMAAAGHGTVEGLKKRFPGYEGNTGREADVVTQVKKTETYTEPGEDTSYTPGIVHETDAITPWENRWNRRVQKQNERWSRQEARKDLRNIAKQEARNIRQEGGTWAEGWKGRRNVMTGRAELSDQEQALYNESRGISDQQTRMMDTGRSMDQLNQGASGSDVVKTKKDMDKYDASTMKGTAALEQTKKNLGGDYSRLGVAGEGSGSSSSGSANGGLSGRAATRAEMAAGQEKASVKGKVGSIETTAPEMKLAANFTRKPSEFIVNNTKSVDRPIGGVPQPQANLKPNLNVTKPSPKTGVAGTGMSAQEITDLAEAKAEKSNAATRGANAYVAEGVKANTGTAPRSSYNRTSPPLVDGTPTLDKKDSQSNSLVSATKMRYQSNVGMKGKSPLKKGYFK